MSKLEALQMAVNCTDVPKVSCLIANELLNVFVPQFSTC